jgi:hypothetical protein
METRAKKAKLSSMDPLGRVCSDLHDLMLQHIKKKEVLHLTTVSPDWNFAISSSSVAMSKVLLKLNDNDDPEDPMLKVMLKSIRQYNNLCIIFTDQEEFPELKLLEKFSPLLKEWNIWMDRVFVPIPSLTFPKLDSLKIYSCKRPIVFANLTKLKKLRYGSKHFNQEAIDWIQSQTRLEELEMSGKVENFFKFNPIAPSGVKRFITYNDYYEFNEEDAVKLNNFLKPICSTLTYLSLDSCFRENLELIINEMPNLETFRCWEDFEDVRGMKLKPNENITKLKIFSLKGPGVYNLLRSLVNLEVLELFDTKSIDEFEWIARNMPKLKRLLVRWNMIFKKFFEERYEEMKATEENINKHIEIQFS